MHWLNNRRLSVRKWSACSKSIRVPTRRQHWLRSRYGYAIRLSFWHNNSVGGDWWCYALSPCLSVLLFVQIRGIIAFHVRLDALVVWCFYSAPERVFCKLVWRMPHEQEHASYVSKEEASKEREKNGRFRDHLLFAYIGYLSLPFNRRHNTQTHTYSEHQMRRHRFIYRNERIHAFEIEKKSEENQRERAIHIERAMRAAASSVQYVQYSSTST